MGKKTKLKKRTAAGLSDDEEDEDYSMKARCPHLAQRARATSVKNALPHLALVCVECRPNTAPPPDSGTKRKGKGKGKKQVGDSAAVTVIEPSDIEDLLVCLKCGQPFCNDEGGMEHAMKHHQEKGHCIMAYLSDYRVWCFDCNMQLDDSMSAEIPRALDHIHSVVKKQVAVPKHGSGQHGSITSDTFSPLAPAAIKGPLFAPYHKSSKMDLTSKPPQVKGLRNLGNTCFMNAVLQSLAQAHLLREHYLSIADTPTPEVTLYPTSRPDDKDSPRALEPITLRLPEEQDSLPLIMAKFLDAMHDPAQSPILNPAPILDEVCHRSPRFRGFRQQDSQELLRTVLDILETSEQKRYKRALLDHFHLPVNVSPSQVDKETQAAINAYFGGAPNYVDSIFGGRLASTVQCNECRSVSRTVEHFLDLSLPIVQAPRPPAAGGTLRMRLKKPVTMLAGQVMGSMAKEPAAAASAAKSKHQLAREAKEAKKAAKLEAKRRGKRRQAEQYDVNPDHSSASSASYSAASEAASTRSGSDQGRGGEHSLSTSNDSGVGRSRATTPVHSMNYDHSYASEDVDVGPLSLQVDAISFRGDVHLEDNFIADFDAAITAGGGLAGEDGPAVAAVSVTTSLCLADADTGECATEPDADCPSAAASSMPGSPAPARAHAADGPAASMPDAARAPAAGPEEKHSLPSTAAEAESLVEAAGATDAAQTTHPAQTEAAAQTAGDELVVTANIEAASESSEASSASGESTAAETAAPAPAATPSSSAPPEGTSNIIRYSCQAGSVVPPYIPKPNECSVQSCLAAFCQPERLVGDNMFNCEECYRRQHGDEQSIDDDAASSSRDSSGESSGEAAAEQDSDTAAGAEANASGHEGEGQWATSEPSNAKKSGSADKPKKERSVKREATKQLLIKRPPKVLTIHLKRFEQQAYRLAKISKPVSFPLILDIAPFCSAECGLSVYDEDEESTGICYGLFGVVEHRGSLSGGHYTAYVRDTSKPLAPGQSSQWWYISDTHVSTVPESRVLNCEAYLLFYERLH